MRARTLAWLTSVLSVGMIVVLIMRVRRGWPAGPKTYAFIAATVIVIIVAIIAWRRAGAETQSEQSAPTR